MILFIVKKDFKKEEKKYDYKKPDSNGFYEIPVEYKQEKINKDNIQLISWNEAKYKPTESDPGKQIKTVKDLFETVLEVAKKDSVCQDMNKQFYNLYKEYIFNPDKTKKDGIFDTFLKEPEDPTIKENDKRYIIKTVYECWPHPMIGNVANSPRCRPQIFIDQYLTNWMTFKKNFMSETTRSKISEMVKPNSKVGLKKEIKSGRDQCRMCKDWKELARAVIGEISSYISKLLEKIYALELCQSTALETNQIELLCKVIDKDKKYEYKVNGKTEYVSFKDLFIKLNVNYTKATDYIRFFFKDIAKLDDEYKWNAFASLINDILSINNERYSKYKLELDKIEDDNDNNNNNTKIIKNLINAVQTLPQTIKCALIFNAFRKFTEPVNAIKNSIQIQQESKDFFSICNIVNAAGNDYIPTLNINIGTQTRSMYLGSWMRDEGHQTTTTNRHFLMPLWAGPSGHANEILGFFNKNLNPIKLHSSDYAKKGSEYHREFTRLANVVLPTMFTFWRLYYDKRISGVHTLAETFDAIFSTSNEATDNWNLQRLELCTRLFNKINDIISKNKLYNYKNVWETLTSLSYIDEKNLYQKLDFYCIYSSIGIMYRIYKKHYDSTKSLSENISALKKEIQDNENKLRGQNKLVIEWAHPINTIDHYKNNTAALNILTNIQITRQDVPKPPTVAKQKNPQPEKKKLFQNMAVLQAEQSSRIQYLYNLITNAQAHQTDFTFEKNEEFNINPPPCLTDAGIVDFVGGMKFNISEVSQTSNSEINYKAIVNTQSDCWNRLKIFGLQDNQPIECIVSENNDSLMFQGEIQLNGSFSIGSIALSLNQLIIESSLDSDYITCRLKASIEANNKTLAVTLYLPLYSGSIDVYGECIDNNVFTFQDLFNIFGLSDIEPKEFLPASEEIFGNLGLQSLHFCLTDSFSISQIGFVISTQNPWSIMPDKISITPVFEIDIDNPFDATNRNIYCTVTGKWILGEGENTTEFDVTLTSELTIYAGLAQGSVLHLDQFVNLFAQGVSFPSITFTDISLMADFKSNNYSFSVAAEDVYSFKVGKAELGIEGVSCSLDFLNGSFGELSLSGSFKLGEMELNVYGSYKGDSSFTFNADAFSDLDYSLGKFITDISGDLLYDGETSFPDEYLTVNIRSLNVSYNSADHNFIGNIDLDHVLEISSDFAINDIKLHISSSDKSPLEFQIQANLLVFETQMTLTLEKSTLGYCFSGDAEFIDETASVKNILNSFNIDTTSIPDFICDFYVKNISAKFEIQENNANSKKIITLGISTSAGDLTVSAEFGGECSWSISYKNDASVNVLNMDVVGELVKVIAPNTTDLIIGPFEVKASNKSGLTLKCKAFSTDVEIPVYQPDPKPDPKLNLIQINQSSSIINSEQKQQEQNVGSSGPSFNGTVFWKKFEPTKTICILSIPKIGLGMDGNYIAVLLDASLNVSPLTFSLNEAGIGVALSKPIAFKFYISGFGVSFDNGVLSIGGSLSIKQAKDKNGNPITDEDGTPVTEYSGMLSIRFKEIGATALGSYSKGHIMAYLSILAPIGGIPAFFVRGLAAGFGYNKKLDLPLIENVNSYPLIKAAQSGVSPQIQEELEQKYLSNEDGQYFLTAGLKFTTFETIEGCMLVTASFGNDFELGLLGLGKLSVPPKVETNPIAYAELAIKASVKPLDGVFSVEAQLTNKSYILSKQCKLTGGFAAYAWFGKNEHSGDFVVTLGGYHPSYQRPAHYPAVPRLGLNWQVDSHTNINGEIYFAMTPGALMAGGKLNLTYTLGDLKAWFIAYADILMKWKPFAYDISIGVLVGASYTMSLFGIRKTFSVELGADLKLWGPEVQAKVHVSWFIISFTISFSEGADHSKDTLDWKGFKQTFLISPKDNESMKQGVLQSSQNDTNYDENNNILSISLQGIIGKTSDGTDIVSAHQLCISAYSKIPENNESSQVIHVRPAGKDCNISNSVMKIVVENDNITEKFECEKIMQNLPAALWGEETSDNINGESLVKNQPCGKKLSIRPSEIDLFPKNQFIQLSVLYENNIIKCKDSFVLSNDASWILKDGDETIEIFRANETNEIADIRKAFLTTHGLSDKDVEDISLTEFTKKADDLLSESILIINV